MIKVVLDTNIIVSANLQALGLPALVLSLAASGKIEMYISAAVVAEYEATLRRAKFKFTPERIEAVLQLITAISTLLTDLPTISESRDETDNRLLECAEAAGAHYLVTGNTKHFPAQWKSTQRVTARELLEIIGPELLEGR